jgi:hypothetical protein
MKQKRFILLQTMLAAFMVLTSCTDIIDNPTPTPSSDDPADDQTAFTVKQVPVNRYGQQDGTVAIRFYEDMPSVPYISAADFQKVVLPGSTFKVTKTGAGVYQLQNQFSTATVNTADETCSFVDFMAFTNLMDRVQPGMPHAYYDGLPFARFSHQTLDGGSPAVTFDYSKYGINLRGDGQMVYFPFTSLADLYADMYNHNAACNGETVVVADRDDDGEQSIDVLEKYFDWKNLKDNVKTCPLDLAAYNYAEFCFVVDHFYGMPGRSPYETGIMADGFDKTLEATEDGSIIKQHMLSENIIDHLYAMDLLNMYLQDGGHTNIFWKDNIAISPDYSYATDYPALAKRYWYEYVNLNNEKAVSVYYLLGPEREAILGQGKTYIKKGQTAICLFDSFSHTDQKAWNDFYAGKGPRPTVETSPKDPMAIFLDALEKAASDPEVKNFVIDLTMNGGGSSDVVVAMTSLMYNQSFVRAQNRVTGQNTTWYYDVDRNFDGKFDAQDQLVHYDLNFCVLTSFRSFSCGNLFPALCKEAGVLIAGEQCGGGSCGVGVYRTPEGISYHISTAHGRLADENWQNIDGGITPHTIIPLGDDLIYEGEGLNYTLPSHAKFYDLDYLNKIINDFYQK